MSAQAVPHTVERISRRQVFSILTSSSSITVVSALQGFGKTVLARQVYTAWSGDRLWFDGAELDGAMNSARINEFIDSPKVTESKPPSKRATRKLLVVDDLDTDIDAFFLQSLLLRYDEWSSHIHVLITCKILPEHIRASLDATTHVHYLFGDDLRFDNNELKSFCPEAEYAQFSWMQLLKFCEGWPAILGIVRQGLRSQTGADITQLSVKNFVSNVIDRLPLDFEHLGIGLLLETEEFDQSLLRLMPEKTSEVVQTLAQLGLLWPAHRYGIPDGYRWPYFVRAHLRSKLRGAYTPINERYRLVAWADETGRFVEALYFAMYFDSPIALARRLINTGVFIQEHGGVRLVREAFALLNLSSEELEPYLAELLFVKLAAFSISSGDVLAETIEEITFLSEKFNEEQKYKVQTWILCIKTFVAVRDMQIAESQKLAGKLAETLHLLPPYFRAKALSALGEFSIMVGELDAALSHFQAGEQLSDAENLYFSCLWHQHQLAQCHTLVGQTQLAENIRLTAIQKAREWQMTASFPYQCLMRAHCEHLQQELKINEAETILTELENLPVLSGDNEGLPIRLLRIENHRLQCMLNHQYRNNVDATILSVERALLNPHHPHVSARANRSLLNLWAQMEALHPVTQWYDRQTYIGEVPCGPEALLTLRNLIFAYLLLQDFGIIREQKWLALSKNQIEQWLRLWPQGAQGVTFLWALASEELTKAERNLMLSRAFGWMSQCNDMAEPMSYQTNWLERLTQRDRPMQRFQLTFLSRLHAVRGRRLSAQPVGHSMNAPGLSKREWQLLESLALGQSNEELATSYNLSLGTVKNHLTRIYRKLGVSGREAACARYKSSKPVTECNSA